GTPTELNTVERESRALLGTLIATAEAYPDLKTSTTVTSLMDSVKGIEEEIARQRYTYNNIVQQFNTMLDTLPSKIIGGLMGLLKLDYLQFEEAIAQPPKIEF
ncbi:MAG: LemA family protein, partial [Methanomicrobiales archaeon]|nr:LemA family protein [Methanomicrobiales archaeon]